MLWRSLVELLGFVKFVFQSLFTVWVLKYEFVAKTHVTVLNYNIFYFQKRTNWIKYSLFFGRFLGSVRTT